jgi:penicillin-binding protein 1A
MAKGKKTTDQKKAGNNNLKKSGKKLNKAVLRKIIFALVVVGLVAGLATTAVGVNLILNTPPIDRERLVAVQTSYLIDKNDQQVWGLHGEENRVLVSLNEIPMLVQNAFIAIEDERFYRHFGWDIQGFLRAAWVNFRARRIVQGGSTISMQLVENSGMITEQSRFIRKVQEIWLAIMLERQYSKEEILEMYLNRIYFGRGAYGVEAAARSYFNKSVGELQPHEAAFLAALIRAPEFYGSMENKAEEGMARMKLVLGSMRRLNYISEAEYEQALSAEFAFIPPPELASPFPWFIDYVVHHELHDILSKIDGFGDRTAIYNAIYTGGLRIYTTLDTTLQGHVQTVLDNNELYPQTLMINMDKLKEAVAANNGELPPDWSTAFLDEVNGVPQPQSALVLADPQTGAIWALGGGRDYAKNRNQDLRFLSMRQPGSAIKPILTYAPAIEEGLLGAGSVLDDAPFIGPGNPLWLPENFDGRFRGMTTVRDALAWSYNLPAVRAFQQLGAQKGADYAYRMGLSGYNPANNTVELGWSLGAREVTPLEMTQAYAVFANDGVRVDLHTVRRIVDRDGQVIFERQAAPVQVLSPQTTFILTDILRDVVRSTTARGLQSPRPMAAKTGTTDAARDIYLSAYAPNVVASFWMGYDIPAMGGISNGWNFTTAVMRTVFAEVFKTLPVEQFKPAPSGVVRVEVCVKSGLLPSEQCREAGEVRADFFLSNHVPRVTCNMHLLLDICTVSGQLAGEFCPPDQIERQDFFNRPEYITTDSRWRYRGRAAPGRKPLDAEDKPPDEICTVHTEYTGEITSFSAQATNGRILLEWRHSGPQVLEFRLYRQIEGETGSALLASLDDDQFSFIDQAVQAGKTYLYNIYAVYAHGPSEPEVARITLRAEQPPAPDNFRAEHMPGNGGGILLSWGYTGAVDRFIIRRSVDGGNWATVSEPSAGDRSFTDTGATAPGSYSYQIVAVRQGVESPPASVVITINNGTGSSAAERSVVAESGGGLRTIFSGLLRQLSALLIIDLS